MLIPNQLLYLGLRYMDNYAGMHSIDQKSLLLNIL